MSTTHAKLAIPVAALGLLSATPASAGTFFFSTGDPDERMATASRPSSSGKIEIESADDFALTSETELTGATFTGLLPVGASLSNVNEVVVEIYQVFPQGSDPTHIPQVPTRVNSPSDRELADRDSASGNLSFTPGLIQSSFTAANSVLNGINPKPDQTTGGEGPVTGEEVEFTVTFTSPFDLAAGHYFFVPQVELSSGDFFWLSAPRPIVPPGTSFPSGFTDLQSWIRNENLAPDWLRIGQDIVGGTPFPTFNATFSLSGSTVPEPSTWAMMLLGFAGLGAAGYCASPKRVVPT
jgi:PEP-CTERM motif